VPAAAVIPAPIAYIKVVAVKKLVVELWSPFGWDLTRGLGSSFASFWGGKEPQAISNRVDFPITQGLEPFLRNWDALNCCVSGSQDIYLEKIRVFKAGEYSLNTLAWDNKIGLLALFCWFLEPE
jgi:hypothetical protein